MKGLGSSLLLSSFLEGLNKHSSSVLMLDYDGTLAPFRINREEAFPNERAMNLLGRLQATNRCKLVVITGRPLADLIPLLSALKTLPELWGSHGLEHRREDGRYIAFQIPPHFKRILEKQWDFFKEKKLTEEIECKPFSLAMHWRGKTIEEAENLKNIALKQWQSIVQQKDFELCPFSGGIELRLKGIGKGFAVKHILANTEKNIPCCYAGDDFTDEDAFSALGDRGLKILLRSHPYQTLADIEFQSIDELCDFLQLWTEGLEEV